MDPGFPPARSPSKVCSFGSMLRRAKAGRKTSCSINKLRRDDDSKISHPALVAKYTSQSGRFCRNRIPRYWITPSTGAIAAGAHKGGLHEDLRPTGDVRSALRSVPECWVRTCCPRRLPREHRQRRKSVHPRSAVPKFWLRSYFECRLVFPRYIICKLRRQILPESISNNSIRERTSD